MSQRQSFTTFRAPAPASHSDATPRSPSSAVARFDPSAPFPAPNRENDASLEEVGDVALNLAGLKKRKSEPSARDAHIDKRTDESVSIDALSPYRDGALTSHGSSPRVMPNVAQPSSLQNGSAFSLAPKNKQLNLSPQSRQRSKFHQYLDSTTNSNSTAFPTINKFSTTNNTRSTSTAYPITPEQSMTIENTTSYSFDNISVSSLLRPPSHLLQPTPGRSRDFLMSGNNFGSPADQYRKESPPPNESEEHGARIMSADGSNVSNDIEETEEIGDGHDEEGPVRPIRTGRKRGRNTQTQAQRDENDEQVDEDAASFARAAAKRARTNGSFSANGSYSDSQENVPAGGPRYLPDDYSPSITNHSSSPQHYIQKRRQARTSAASRLQAELDHYVNENDPKMRALEEKWKDCSMEEWVAAGDEFTKRFSKLTDFVKTYMTARIAAYTQMDNQITDHNKNVLDMRDGQLKDTRGSLAKQAGALFGGGLR